MRPALDEMTIRITAARPLPVTTAAGVRAYQRRATAQTDRLPVAVPRRRGANVIDGTRFLVALGEKLDAQRDPVVGWLVRGALVVSALAVAVSWLIP